MADEFLTREALLKKRARRSTVVTIRADHPEKDLAGKKITVRSMSARERSAWEMQFTDFKTNKPLKSRQAEIRERLVVATVIDPKGNPLLTEDDVEALGEVDAAILEMIAKASQDLNDITEDDIQELEKNSKTQTGSSPSK